MSPTSPPDEHGPPATPARTGARVIRPARGLPSSRAAVGGLLVAVAAIGTWLAASGGGGADSARYVVVRRDVAAGVELTEDLLTTADVDLPDELRAGAFTAPADLVGAVTRGPIGAGELVQTGSVTATEEGTTAELSFAVEPDWAVAGALQVGDRIALYATDDDGVTTLVLGDVAVRDVMDPDDGFGGATGQVVTVALDDSGDFDDAVAAVRTGDITVVRLLRGDGPTPERTTTTEADPDAGTDDDRTGDGSDR